MTGEIKLFQSAQKFNRSMGIYPRHSNKKWSFNAINLVYLIGFAQMSIGTMVYSIFQAKTTIEFGACFYAYTTESTSATYYLIDMWKINNISLLIEHFQAFIEKSKVAHVWHVFCKKNYSFHLKSAFPFKFVLFRSERTGGVRKIEWKNRIRQQNNPLWLGGFNSARCRATGSLCDRREFFLLWPWKWFVLSTFSGHVRATTFIAPSLMHTLNVDFEWFFQFSFEHQKSLPFDWHAPCGYLIAFLAQTIESFCTVYSACPILCIVVGSCWLFIAFVKDLTSELPVLNAAIKSADERQLNVNFCEIIKLYSDVKQLSEVKPLGTAVESKSNWLRCGAIKLLLFFQIHCWIQWHLRIHHVCLFRLERTDYVKYHACHSNGFSWVFIEFFFSNHFAQILK